MCHKVRLEQIRGQCRFCLKRRELPFLPLELGEPTLSQNGQRRHKTALNIFFTDVVGSTAYFDRHGDTAGLAMLQRHAELVANTLTEFRGRVIKTIGDSVMAEFPEPAFAVRAAVELQRRLLLLNQKLYDRERVHLRIGINHGAAFRHGDDVYGDAVNLAARITSGRAEPSPTFTVGPAQRDRQYNPLNMTLHRI